MNFVLDPFGTFYSPLESFTRSCRFGIVVTRIPVEHLVQRQFPPPAEPDHPFNHLEAQAVDQPAKLQNQLSDSPTRYRDTEDDNVPYLDYP